MEIVLCFDLLIVVVVIVGIRLIIFPSIVLHVASLSFVFHVVLPFFSEMAVR